MTSRVLPMDGLRFAISPLAATAAAFFCSLAAPPAQAAETVALEGTLAVAHSDDFAGKRTTTRYLLRTKTKQLRLRPGSQRLKARLARAASGARIEVKGTRTGNTIDATSGTVTEAAARSASANRAYKIAVIMLSSDGRKPYTEAALRDTIFGQVSSFYERQSNGEAKFEGIDNIAGDVFGWYDVQGIDPQSPGDNCAELHWSNQAMSQATAEHGSLSDYDSLVFVFAGQSSCGYAGMAWVGGSTTGPVRAFINGYGQNWGVIAHELGHNMGLLHANTYTCKQGSKKVAISDSCTTSEYGDPFDVMGSGGSGGFTPVGGTVGGPLAGDFNARHLARLDEYAKFPAFPVRDVTASGDYTLAPITPGSALVQSLRLKKTGTSPELNYYLQTDPGNKIRIVLDKRITPPGKTHPSSDTQLIDTTPESAGFGDSALLSGATFSDPDANLSVTNLGVGVDGSLAVRVDTEGGGPPPPPPPPPPPATDEIDPVVTIASPVNGADADDIIPISASATDNVAVKRMEIYVDGKRKLRRNKAAIDRRWNPKPKGIAVGEHTILVKAFDAAGNEGSASVVVTK